MANDRLTSSDRRALLLWLLLGAAGALFAYKYFFDAFPEASVNFQVSRTEALDRARQFVTRLGGDVSGYQSSIVFEVDDNAKTYLEREVGLQHANRMMASDVSIWYWSVRFFRIQQEEEYDVRVSPAGKITGYEHKIEEARAGAALGRTAAEAQAKQFLAGQYGVAPGDWDFLPEEANSKQLPKRLNWSFTWEKHGFRAKDAPYRLRVTLTGDTIGRAEEFLQVPEAWQRGYRTLRSSNEFYNAVAILPYFLLLGAALWLGISLTRRGETHWGGAIKLGLVVAFLLFLMQINEWPQTRGSYDTNSSYGSFVAMSFVLALLFALGSALTVVLVLPAAEPLYRASQPQCLQLGKAFSRRGLRTKEFFNSAAVGLCLAAAHIGFVVAFYLVGSRFGVWAPQEINYTESINTAIPWISGVAIGLLAATNEEFTFRLFAIPFLERVTGSRWLAVILPAFAWSFLHSGYPQEPGYIRGIEVGIIGIVAGVVMLRWGILATLIWHYTVDAMLVGLLLIRSNSLYFKLSGVIVGAAAVAPLLFAGASYLLRGRFETDESLLNQAAPQPEISFAPAPPSETTTISARQYDPLSLGMIGFLAACLVAGGACAWKIRSQSIGDYLRLPINARDARRIADDAMRARNLRPESFRTATVLDERMGPFTNEYLRRTAGIAEANRIYRDEVPGALWHVRYFRDGQKEEYAVLLRPDGALHAVGHTLEEASPGASLTKEEAIARAELFLREQKHLDLSQWRLIEPSSDKKPHRIDHTLIWEQTRGFPSVAESAAEPPAHARIEVQVLGDEVTNYNAFIKIPDEWVRKQKENTLPLTLYKIGQSLLFLGLGMTALVLYLVRMRSPEAPLVPWKFLGLWSLVGLAAFLLSFFLGSKISDLLSLYQTEIPLRYMFGIAGIGAVLGGVFTYGGILLLLGLAWYFGSRAFGAACLPGGTRVSAEYYRDAVWIGMGGTAVFVALGRVIAVIESRWPTIHHSIDASLGRDFYATLPFASVFGTTLLRGLFWTGIVALAAGFFTAEVRQRWVRALLFVLAAAALVGSWGSPGDFVKQFLGRAILIAVIVWGVRHVLHKNVLGCFLVAASITLLGGAADLLSQPNPFFRANGNALLLALGLLFLWPFLAWRLRRVGRANT